MHNSKPTPCEVWEEKLVTMCPDDLVGSERKAFEAHAATCRACAAVRDEDSRFDTLLRDALIIKQPLGLWKAIIANDLNDRLY